MSPYTRNLETKTSENKRIHANTHVFAAESGGENKRQQSKTCENMRKRPLAALVYTHTLYIHTSMTLYIVLLFNLGRSFAF